MVQPVVTEQPLVLESVSTDVFLPVVADRDDGSKVTLPQIFGAPPSRRIYD